MADKATTCALIFLMALAPTIVSGQSADVRPERISVEDGLSSPIVTDIVQDERGFLWIATLQGLNRYDGSEVVRFMGDGTEGSLPANGINHMLLARDSLYAATARGIAVLDKNGYTTRVVHLWPTRGDDRREGQVQGILRDALGQFWASTPTSIYRLDSNLAVLDEFLTQANPTASLNRNVYRAILLPSGEALFQVPSGWRYWSPKSRGLEQLEEGAGRKYRFLAGSGIGAGSLVGEHYLLTVGSDSVSVHNMRTATTMAFPLADRSEWTNLFVLHGHEFALRRSNGLSFYALGDDGQSVVPKHRMSGLLRGANVNGVVQDDEGNYWVATSNGLVKIRGGSHLFHNQKLRGRPDANEDNMEAIEIFAHGPHLFIGTTGEGFFQVDTVTGEEQHHLLGPAASMVNVVWNFRAAGGDTLWVGTQQGLMYCALGTHRSGRLRLRYPEVMDSVAITALHDDSRHRVWIGLGRGKGVALYDGATRNFRMFPYGPEGYPFPYPLHAGEDAGGNEWFISVATGNLVTWDDRAERFRVVEVPGLDATANEAYGSFLIDRERDEVWYGIAPSGLVCYRIGEGSSRIYGTKDGLPTGRIHGIAKDGHGRLWLGTGQGLSCFDPAMGIVVNFTPADGLAASPYTALHYDRSTNRIYACATGTLSWFNVPEQLTDDRLLRTWLTGVDVNGRPVRPPGNGLLSLGPNEGNITVKFSSINLTDGNGNRYQYRLNGGEWTGLGKEAVVRFASIKAGQYRLEVRAARKLGQFGPAHSLLDFSVRPRFTSTIWFYLLSLGTVGALAWAWYRYRLRNLRKLEAIRTQISHDLHDEIGSRLTNINMMSQIIRQAPAGEGLGQGLLGKIQEESEEITQSMREIIWSVDPAHDQLELALPRLLTFATQLLEAAGMEVRAEMDDAGNMELDMAARRDLFLIFKEAVNNAVKHSWARHVILRFKNRENAIQIEVEDDGAGMPSMPTGPGSGLRYMRERAARHGWELTVESRPGAGTTIRLRIPFRKAT